VSSDNIVSVQSVIRNLQDYEDYYIKEIKDGSIVLLWKNPRTGAFVYVGVMDAFNGKIQGGALTKD
jgi:hypothetical protein